MQYGEFRLGNAIEVYDWEDTGDGPVCIQWILNVTERVCLCVF